VAPVRGLQVLGELVSLLDVDDLVVRGDDSGAAAVVGVALGALALEHP